MTPEEFQNKIDDAVSSLDKGAAKELCDRLIAELPKQDDLFPVGPAKAILSSLRRKRYFNLMTQVADALISNGQGHAQVRRQYGQALIDSGHLNAALAVLAEIAGDLASPLSEVAEARGLIGRAHKQFYVNHPDATLARKQGALEDAVRSYKQVYDSNPDGYLWHGINVVALLARAERDGVPVSTDEDYRDIARRISETIQDRHNDSAATLWDYGTVMEAAVALGNADSATIWAERYVQRGPDAFELGSTLRQLEEVWGVTSEDEVGQGVVLLLNAALLEAETGSLRMSRLEYSGHKENAGAMQFERVFGPDSYKRISWLKMALDSCQAIGQVTTRTGTAVGTGFVVKGKSLSPRLEDDWYFLTNSHVITDDEEVLRNSPRGRKPLKPDQAHVTFELLFERERPSFQVKEVIFTSPPNENGLDVTLLRLKEPFYEGKVEPYPITRDLPGLEEQRRVYIAGYPGGGDLNVSLHDNHLLDYNDELMQYRTPTDPGSSGSPVFNDEWELVGIHHAGSYEKQSLRDSSKVHEANEGIRISAIIKAIEQGH